jgi:hypothetical protein
MPTPQQLLAAFQKMGSRSALTLKDGRQCEGYILDVEGGYLLFGHGGPDAPNEPERIPVEAVDLGSLSYWDEARCCWMDARWDEVRATWLHTPARVDGDSVPF